jgi:hypothetical protein
MYLTKKKTAIALEARIIKLAKTHTQNVLLRNFSTHVGGWSMKKVQIIWESNLGETFMTSYVTSTLTIPNKVARIRQL